jgi:hypothetical protein
MPPVSGLPPLGRIVNARASRLYIRIHHHNTRRNALPWHSDCLQPSSLFRTAVVRPSFHTTHTFALALPTGATIQVLLFAVLAIEVKRKAPTAHTVLEIVKARWGTSAHLVFLVFCFLTNLIVTAMLILGGAAVTTALTGEWISQLPPTLPLPACCACLVCSLNKAAY